MISLRQKAIANENLIPEAKKYLKEKDVPFTVIKEKDADKASLVNTKAMVLMDFSKNDDGVYQITIKDKKFYSYTRKVLEMYFGMRILSTDKKERTFTAEVEHIGEALDAIEVLGLKYNLSIVDK